MSYENLLVGMKGRIMSETELAFENHHAFSEKVKVYNKFPYQERIQYGVVLRNASASQIRLSPDNFISDLFSLTRLARTGNFPGNSIEWVRENADSITEVTTEDVTQQLGSTQRLFYTTKQMLAGPGNTNFADDPGQIKVKVNGVKQNAVAVDGEERSVLLARAPGDGVSVEVSYWSRQIVDPAIFVVEFSEDNEFYLDAYFTIEDELVIERTTGTETTASLAHTNIHVGSDIIYLAHTDGQKIVALDRGTDYTINYPTGVITFLTPLQKNYSIYAIYMHKDTNYMSGPFRFEPYQEIHDAIPGVIISIGRRAMKGDKQIIQVSQIREQQARIYGGHWEMSLELAVIAKDPMQMEQMSDHLVTFLWGNRKNILEWEGITLNSVEPTGESEEVHIDLTGDLYYESSVSVNVQTEWQSFEPYLPLFRIKNIYVLPDGRPVLKAPVVGYERLT